MGRWPFMFQHLQQTKTGEAPRVSSSPAGFVKSFSTKKIIMLALNRRTASDDLSSINCLPKCTFNFHPTASTMYSMSEQGYMVLSQISVPIQKLRTNNTFACTSDNDTSALLTAGSARAKERDRFYAVSNQDLSGSPSCQRPSFSRPCHMSHLSSTGVISHHEHLANPAFTDLQFAQDSAKHDDFTTYKSPTHLLAPFSPFYSHKPGHPYISPSAAKPTYLCRTYTVFTSMDCLKRSLPSSAGTLLACTQQNPEARGDALSLLAQPDRRSTSQSNNTQVLRSRTILTPSGSIMNKYLERSYAQQVDSIFANRDPRVRRRLYSGSSRSTKHRWFEKAFVTHPISPGSISGSLREEPRPSSMDLFEEAELGKEWICISRRHKYQPCLSIISDTWCRRASTSTESILRPPDSISVVIEESNKFAEPNLQNDSFMSTEDSDEDPGLELNEVYEIVPRSTDDGILEEWEVLSPLSAQTSYCESDDDFSSEENE